MFCAGMSRYPARERKPPTRLVMLPEHDDGTERLRYDEEAVVTKDVIDESMPQELQEWLEGHSSDSDYTDVSSESGESTSSGSEISEEDLSEELKDLESEAVDVEAEYLALTHDTNPLMNFIAASSDSSDEYVEEDMDSGSSEEDTEEESEDDESDEGDEGESDSE
jgi:hypothetical protein